MSRPRALPNVGRLDQVIRFVLGVLLLGLYGALDSPWKYLTLFGLVLIGTAISRRCPLYASFGIQTVRQPPHDGPSAS